MSNDLAAHYMMDRDIDASATSTWNSGNGFVPVGTLATRFTGSLSGQNYTVTDLYINHSSAYAGLIGITSGATLSGIKLANADVSGVGNTGALVGYLDNSSTVTECSVTGTVTSTGSGTGGMFGAIWNSSIVRRSFSNVAVTLNGPINLGGFAGVITDNTLVENCYSQGSVSGTAFDNVGAFAGTVHFPGGNTCTPGGTIVNVYASLSSISSGDSNQAGLIGVLENCQVTNSYCLDTNDSGTSACSNNLAGGNLSGGGQRTAAQLQCPVTAGENCNGATSYSGWSSSVWNFGSSSQLPWPQWYGATPP